ncbi:hypothetical protein BGZ94_002994 [Podila epigama]|nr:hypothetical protein BGZ94_002994 [Podila epigama]
MDPQQHQSHLQQQHQYAHVPQYGIPPPPHQYAHMMPPHQTMMPPPQDHHPLGPGGPPPPTGVSGYPGGYGAAPGPHDSMRGMPPRSPPRYRGAPRSGYRERSFSPPRRRTPSPRGYRDGGRGGYDRMPQNYGRGGYDRGGYDRGSGYDRSERYDRFDSRGYDYRGGYERGYDRYDRGGYGGNRGYDRGYGNSRPRSPPRRTRTINRGTEEDRAASKTLYIGNIPYSFREPEVEEMFKKFGTIIKVTVVIDQYTGRNKGFAFVEYEDRKAAEEAMEKYNGFDVEGRRLKIDWDIGLGKKDIKPPRVTGESRGTAEPSNQEQPSETSTGDHNQEKVEQEAATSEAVADQSTEQVSAEASNVVSDETPVDQPLAVEQAPYATSTEEYISKSTHSEHQPDEEHPKTAIEPDVHEISD